MNEPIEHKAPSRFDVSAALPKVARAPAAYPVLTYPTRWREPPNGITH
jgi:hypothetical protein